MKSVFTLFFACILCCNLASSQVLFSDNFIYTGIDGDSLTNATVGGTVWKSHSGTAGPTKTLQFQNSSLSLAGYAGSGLGGSVNFKNNSRSQDANAFIGSSIKTGFLYTSFLLKIDSSAAKDTSTDYFFHLFDTSGVTNGTNFRGRVFVSDGSSITKFKIGLSKGTGAKLTAANITAGAKAPIFTTTEYNIGQTYLIVLKYTFNTATGKDDIIDLFVVDGTIPSTEPAATISFQDTAVNDLKQIQSVAIRQAGTGRTQGTIDGIKVFYIWSDILGGGATTTFSINATAAANGTISPSGAVVVNAGSNQIFNIVANSGYAVQDVLVDGVSVGAVSSYTFTNVTVAHNIAASFKTSATSGILFSDNFIYTGIDGDSLTNATVGGVVWKSHSGTAGPTKTLQFQNSSLSLAGYAGSGLGGSVIFQNNLRSQDANAFIGSSIKTGSLYTSLLLKIDSSAAKDTSTDYFFHLFDTSGVTNGTNFRGRVFVSDGSSNTKFKIGLSKGTGAKLTAANITAGAKAPIFTTTEYNIGQTYLVVLKYTFNTATGRDDVMDLFVVDGTIPSTEPGATISIQDTAISDLKQIQSVAIRQGGTGRTFGTIDGIKVFKNWSDIVPAITTTYGIAGNIVSAGGKKLNTVNITLSGAVSSASINNTTSTYNFPNLNTGSYVIKASKNNDIKKSNGVSSIDVILMQNHILNKIKFNSPYKIIAADVNNDKSVSSIDVIFAKRLILGIDTTFRGNRLWAFVDSSYKFVDTTKPFPFSDSISINNLTANKTNQTFIAIKLGDVSYDWNPAFARGNSIANLELLISNYQNQTGITNSKLEIPFKVKNFKNLKALQYTLHFNNDLFDFVEVRNNKFAIEYNAAQANKTGDISFLWANAKGEDITLEDETDFFTLVLSAKKFVTSKLDAGITLSNDITETEAWDENLNKHNIVLVKKNNNQQLNEVSNQLFSVSPNPTSGEVAVKISVVENKVITLNLLNESGKIIFTKKLIATKGNNKYQLNLSQNANLLNGTYYLKAIGIDGDDTKKVMIINK